MRQTGTGKRVSLTVIGVVAAAAAFSAASAHADLLGYWKLNETSGNIASDSSGNNRHGTLRGELTDPPDPGPVWVPDGMFDGAISLDGLNDRIHVPYEPALEYSGDNMTLSTWFYRDEGDTTTGNLISKPWNSSGRYNYRLFVTGSVDTTIGFRLSNSQPADPKNVDLYSPAYSSFAGAWHHVGAVADSANNMMLYVNGQLAASRTNTIDDWTGTIEQRDLVLGALFPYSSTWAGVTSHAFHGKLDDMAIFNDALDPAKVMSIYNVPTTLGLSYDLGDMTTLWAAYDAGPAGAGAVNRTPWQYTDELPGSPPAPGGAYTHGDAMYIVLGSGDGLRSPAITNWVGGGADGHWSTAANWSPATTDPYGYLLHFDDGVPVDATKLSGTVDDSYTVAGMRLNNLSADYETVDPDGARHYTFEVPPGTTLTVSGGVNIGYQFSSWGAAESVRNRYPVTGQFTGGGEMVINGPVLIQNSGRGTPREAATLDVSGLSKFTIDTTGDIALGGRNDGRGVLILSPDNLLRATNILAPGAANHSSSPLLGGVLALGQKNTIHADTIAIGGMGLSADMLFQEGLTGPEVTIRNYAGDGPANLYVGHTRGNVRTHTGTVDFSGGTVDAQLDELQIGVFDVVTTTITRTATGILTMSAGTINANDVVVGRNMSGTDSSFSAHGFLNIHGGDFAAGSIALGQHVVSNNPDNRARGTIDLSCGTLTAGTIEKGDGEAVFNFTGGTLHVDTFGSAAKPFTLDQLGGTLAPGNSIGTTTIYGDYNQAADGILQIEIAGTGTPGIDFDFVEVFGNTLLEGWLEVLLIPDFTAKPGDTFDVLHTSGTLNIAGDLSDRLLGHLPSPTFGWWEVATVLGAGGDGMTLRLSAVPEPSALLLFGLGMVGLLMVGGRRSGKRAGLG